jgi:ABC-type sulfate/molybdate transport systems ATPase subunit
VSHWSAHFEVKRGDLAMELRLQGPRGPLVVVGPNGSGKTSLLRLLAGVVSPDRGRLQVGQELWLDTEGGLEVPCQRRQVGYVPQGYGLFPHMSVVDNVAFGLSVGPERAPRRRRRARALEALAELGCQGLADRRPATLSGGEAQRVALARALVRQPRLLLLDEPMAALDVGARRQVRAFLVEQLQGRASVVVTHDLRDVQALGAPICVLEQGRVVQRGALEELRAAPANAFVAELVGAPLGPRG